MLRTLIAAILIPLAGCATIMEGSSQSVSFNTSPAGALCKVSRAGAPLGDVSTTPGTLHLDKSKNDLTVTCSKDGYATATISQSPKFVGTTFGNIVAGGLIGVAVDAATGANYTYPDTVQVSLEAAAPKAVAEKALVPQPAMAGSPAPSQPGT